MMLLHNGSLLLQIEITGLKLQNITDITVLIREQYQLPQTSECDEAGTYTVCSQTSKTDILLKYTLIYRYIINI